MDTKSLTENLHITDEQAATVLGLVNGEIDPATIEATADWIRQCHNRPWDSALIMHAIDATIETNGVEALGPEIDHRFTPAFEYCNAGDTYSATIIRDNETGEYFISTMGDVVESNPELFGEG